MSRLDRNVSIDAPTAVVWRVMADVEHWPDWTPTILAVKPRWTGLFGVGSSALVTPRGRGEAPWTVTEFEPGRSFTWETKSGASLWVIGGHVVEPDGAGARVTLSISTRGAAAPLFSWLVARLSRRNVEQEAASLKRRSEELARTTA